MHFMTFYNYLFIYLIFKIFFSFWKPILFRTLKVLFNDRFEF